ncbi:uncharacterized protein ACN427_012337 [Glossina fuscipes fuscipes]
MGKLQFCRICRTVRNLKYSLKELRQINKKQLLVAQGAEGRKNDRASKKLFRTTPLLGNICLDCDERLKIFHRLDDNVQDINEDIEIDVVNSNNHSITGISITSRPRADSPVIVDDDDMLYSLFMQKMEQQKHLQQQQQQVVQERSKGAQCEETNIINGCRPTDVDSTSELITALPAPIPASQVMVDKHGHRIVAIIDLEDGEDSLPSPAKALTHQQQIPLKESLIFQPNLNLGHTAETDDGDNEIVFRKVGPESRTMTKEKNRSSYDGKQLRLVASLSLLSSDSEAESDNKMKTEKAQEMVKQVSPVAPAVKPAFECTDCQATLADRKASTNHPPIHVIVKCPQCKLGFPKAQSLVHHMRYKHREYNGHVLMERPRAPQDSAMTIRLRYMQQSTFYECQLCGHINEVYKEHKEHILEKHAMESRCLKDPIMKQLKCPVCKVKCGAQYLSLCRHLLAAHQPNQYRTHLRELFQVSAFGWNASRQKEVAQTARIYQFTKRKTFFFECKLCRKVVVGYLHHLRHLGQHRSNSPRRKDEKPKGNKKLQSSNKALIESKETLSKRKRRLNEISETKKMTIIDEQKILKTCKKTKLKRKEKEKQLNEHLKQLKIVKVRPPLKQVYLQIYTCGYCRQKFKGFRLYNLHLLQHHVHDEFHKCETCQKFFRTVKILENHSLQCLNNTQQKQKRKHIQVPCAKVDENCNNGCKRMKNAVTVSTKHKQQRKLRQHQQQHQVPKNNETYRQVEYNANLWLYDLLKLSERRTLNINNDDKNRTTALKYRSYPAVQCSYCLHLFANSQDFKQHVKFVHSHQRQDVRIKYQPIRQ